MALINNEPRVCDIVAISDSVDIYTLDRAIFERILGSLSEIMKRTVSKRTKQNQAGAESSATSLRDIPKSQLKEIAFLGTGTFGRVSLVQDKKTGEVMALKAMSKAQIVAHRQQTNVMNEKVSCERSEGGGGVRREGQRARIRRRKTRPFHPPLLLTYSPPPY
jgi:hypothetical protein